MAASNTPDAVADAERRPGKGRRWRRSPYWPEYATMATSMATTVGMLLMVWDEDSRALLWAGFVLFLVASPLFLVAYAVLTWKLARWIAPRLVGQLLKSVRSLFPKTDPNVIEK